MMALAGVVPTPRPVSIAFSAASSFSAGVPLASGPRMTSAPKVRRTARLTSRLPRIWASACATAEASSGWALRSVTPTRGWYTYSCPAPA